MPIDDDSCTVTANQACCRQDDKLRLATSGAFCVSGGLMGEVVKFKPRHEIECERAEPVGQSAARNFWIGPEQTNIKPDKDTAPSEFCAPDGDCG